MIISLLKGGNRSIFLLRSTTRRTIATTASSGDFETTIDLVKHRSVDYFYAGCMIPDRMKMPFFVAHCFNTDVAIIRDKIDGNVLAGRMRLQWMRDQVNGVFEKTSMGATPLLRCINEMINQYNWSFCFLDRIIEARETDLNDEPIQSMNDIDTYGEMVYGSMGYLLMQSFHIENESMVEAWRLLSHIMAVATLLRGSPYHLQHNKSYFPLDLMKKHHVLPIDVCDVKSDGVKSVVKDMTDTALSNYMEVKKLWKQGCKGENEDYERMILLGSPAIFYLQSLMKQDYNLINKPLSSPFMNFKLQNRLLRQKLLNCY